MVTVVIVDDHPIVRTGMRTVLDAAADVTVVAEGTTGDDALCLVEQHCPDVLVLDVNLPDMNGLDVVRCLHDQGTTTAILVLTMHADSHTFFGLLKAGVAGQRSAGRSAGAKLVQPGSVSPGYAPRRRANPFVPGITHPARDGSRDTTGAVPASVRRPRQ